ncbi:MAG: hypothetical protein HRU25_03155 [Psychrobium sp.]|nr:hypothetical protein [Psychrobium sp.]
MNYLEVFSYVVLAWGIVGLLCLSLGESRPRHYTKFAPLMLIISWAYLVACVPVFQAKQFIPAQMSFFYGAVAALLSIEVWLIFLSTLIAIGLAKKNHDPDHHSYMAQWHIPMRKVIKPLWSIICVANVINALYFHALS